MGFLFREQSLIIYLSSSITILYGSRKTIATAGQWLCDGLSVIFIAFELQRMILIQFKLGINLMQCKSSLRVCALSLNAISILYNTLYYTMCQLIFYGFFLLCLRNKKIFIRYLQYTYNHDKPIRFQLSKYINKQIICGYSSILVHVYFKK